MTPEHVSEMLQTMTAMQTAHNEQVHPQWRTQGYAYYRAIWVECAEMLDHYGWKWWKKQTPDLNQVKLELVDIWHFGLSELIRSNRLDDQVGFALSEVDAAAEPDPDALRLAIEALAESSLRTRSFEMAPFIEAMSALSLSVTELFKQNVGKNVLNQFRQNNGYKDGSYRKIWQGREDNEHLVDLLARLDVAASEVPNALYRQLEAIYVR